MSTKKETDTEAEVVLSKKDKLKKLNADRKKLNDEAKALKAEMDKNKDARTAGRKELAALRKVIRNHKKDLRELHAVINDTLHATDLTKVDTLADQLTEHSTALSAAVRKFGEVTKAQREL